MTIRNAAQPAERRTWAHTLDAIAVHAGADAVVRKRELGFGDRVTVKTRNSVYRLLALGGDWFLVTGGWFDKRQASPARVMLNGCTFGGRAIRSDVVAGRGLFLEFDNSVTSTRILDVQVQRLDQATPA